jgi:hypothetical protein
MPSFIEGIQASNHKRGLNPIPILAIFLEKTMFSEKKYAPACSFWPFNYQI